MAKYLLIYDTGDFLFETKKEALRYAEGLKKRGHKLDRLQENRPHWKKYKTKPKIFKLW